MILFFNELVQKKNRGFNYEFESFDLFFVGLSRSLSDRHNYFLLVYLVNFVAENLSIGIIGRHNSIYLLDLLGTSK